MTSTAMPLQTTSTLGRRLRRSAQRAAVVATAALTLLAVTGSPASAREGSSQSKDGCSISVTRPTAPSTWTRKVTLTVRCSSTRTIQYGSLGVMNDRHNAADTVAASASLSAGKVLYGGQTYTWTATWNSGSTNGYGQYSRGVVKMNNWSAAAVVESTSVNGVSYGGLR